MDFVYLLRCSDNSLYCGWTTDVEKRVATHNAGRGAKYTKPRLPVHLVHVEEHPSRSAALKREAAIKRLTKARKEQLIMQTKFIA